MQAIVDAVAELERQGPGDVLVFLSGEREIHDSGRRAAPPRPTRHRGAPAVRPVVVGGAAPHLPTPSRPAHRAQHERRRNVDHRSRRALRRRCRHRSDLPLQPAPQGPTTADRTDLAGVGEPAGREVWTRRAGNLHSPVQRGRLRRPPGVHRARDPAHQPGVSHPPDDSDRPRRRGRLPVRRATGLRDDPRRLPAARGAGGDRRCR